MPCSVLKTRRRREAAVLHARCCVVLDHSVAVARAGLVRATGRERAIRLARVRKLEELAAWATAIEG